MDKSISRNLYILFAIVFALILTSCEEVINVDLNSPDPKIVIEGVVTAPPGSTIVKISRTTDYFTPELPPAVSGALVIISYDSVYSDTLHETDPGIYLSYSPHGMTGRTYNLSVTVGEDTYTASSTMPRRINIDSLECEYQTADELWPQSDSAGYILHCHFTDPLDDDTYGRIKVYSFRDQGWLDRYYLYYGDYSDGNSINYQNFFEIFYPGDTIHVELYTIEEDIFFYYWTLSQVLASDDRDQSSGSPANPNTNLSGGALGYFSAMTVSIKSIIVPPLR